MKKVIAFLILMIFTCGCTVGPNYKRPKIDVPGAYRGAPSQEAQPQPSASQQTPSQQAASQQAAPQQISGLAENSSQQGSQSADHPSLQASQPGEQSFGDQKWWEVFQDPQLQQLIRAALDNNYDVRIAATRILEAQAQLGITRADQLPTISAGAAAVNDRYARQKPLPEFETNTNSVSASMFWDLDFWGKYRRATEAARANLLATEWARRAVINTLVSNVAASYFQLRAYDLQLEISRRTQATRQESLQLTQTLADGGAATMLDVRQAEQLVAVAAEEIPDFERRIQQQENFISTLLGNNPGPVARGMQLTEQPHLPEVPPGIPSRLLERRPDIRAAEAQLMAANAQIGVARAAYFPQITLTASSGFQSSALTSLFTGPAGFWSLGGSLAQPIFAGGRIKAGVRLSEARQKEMVLTYQQTIQQAFRGVSDALVGYQKNREFRVHQQELVIAAQEAAQLSEERYRGGATSYLEVLTNETNSFNAELGLAQAQLNELVSLVDIYKNLGGGWEL
ncbi:MAG TPA: efflux transporter outer membrane subunit [Terriglobales bacterium]|nr:efflux transporter outer membrane subunit [Terriglobales bacterium]